MFCFLFYEVVVKRLTVGMKWARNYLRSCLAFEWILLSGGNYWFWLASLILYLLWKGGWQHCSPLRGDCGVTVHVPPSGESGGGEGVQRLLFWGYILLHDNKFKALFSTLKQTQSYIRIESKICMSFYKKKLDFRTISGLLQDGWCYSWGPGELCSLHSALRASLEEGFEKHCEKMAGKL